MRKLLAIAACSNALVIAPAIAQTPAESVILRGAYLTLASCAFLKLDKEGLRKADLQSSSRIEFVPGTMRIWLLNFEQISKSETRVTFTKSM